MRAPFFLSLTLALAACTSSIPDSGAGVGFDGYDGYNAQPVPSPMPVAPAPAAGGFSTDGAAAAIDRATGVAPVTPMASPQPGYPQPAYPQPAYPQPTYPQPVTALAPATDPNAGFAGSVPAGIKEEAGETQHYAEPGAEPGISDEQDFAAVAARETIQSDKARIERNRAQYQVDQPGALPQRAGGDQTALIIQFALATNHPVGTQMYKRSSMRLGSADAACAKFGTPDQAQEAFLDAGGPERDRKGIDPDGDGYACSWNPAPFRAALQ